VWWSQDRRAPFALPEASMYAVLALVLLVQQPAQKKENLTYAAAVREEVIKEYALQPNADDSPLRKLQREHCIDRATAISMWRFVIPIMSWFNPLYFVDYIELHVTLFEDLAELADKPANKVKWYEIRVEKLKEVEKLVKQIYEIGINPPGIDLTLARAARIDAEIELLKLKESLKGGK
jgi:hypothetical protein